MPSFDVVSKINQHELENAVAQSHKEVSTRFDFRGTDVAIERTPEGVMVRANGEGRVEAAVGVLREKCSKRGVSLRALDPQKLEPGSKGAFKQLIKIKEGIERDKAKELTQFIKDQKLKVQASIQGDELRVSGKSKDELQTAIAALKSKDFGVDLQFQNFRD